VAAFLTAHARSPRTRHVREGSLAEATMIL
jgi:hypothetical protein